MIETGFVVFLGVAVETAPSLDVEAAGTRRGTGPAGLSSGPDHPLGDIQRGDGSDGGWTDDESGDCCSDQSRPSKPRRPQHE